MQEMKYLIRELMEQELEEAVRLIHTVFQQFVEKDYEEEGICNFHKFTSYYHMREEYRNKGLLFFGAFQQEQIVGVVAIKEYQHICLLFVKEEYQNKGIASGLIQEVIEIAKQNNQGVSKITVNSSPCAKEFYHKSGFQDLDSLKIMDGIKFIPMKKDL